MSVLKSETSQKSPTIVPISVPFERTGGWPGAMKDSTVASQAPAWSLRMACSGPGLGKAGAAGAAGLGFFSCANPAAAHARRAPAARNMRLDFMRTSRMTSILSHLSAAGAIVRPARGPAAVGDAPGVSVGETLPVDDPLAGHVRGERDLGPVGRVGRVVVERGPADQDLLAAGVQLVLDELAGIAAPAAPDVDDAPAIRMEAWLASRGMHLRERPLLSADDLHDVDAEALGPVRREHDAAPVAAPARVAQAGAAAVAHEHAIRARGQVHHVERFRPVLVRQQGQRAAVRRRLGLPLAIAIVPEAARRPARRGHAVDLPVPAAVGGEEDGRAVRAPARQRVHVGIGGETARRAALRAHDVQVLVAAYRPFEDELERRGRGGLTRSHGQDPRGERDPVQFPTPAGNAEIARTAMWR